MVKRPTCPIECNCICHDTGGGNYGEHGWLGICPGKLGFFNGLPEELDNPVASD